MVFLVNALDFMLSSELTTTRGEISMPIAMQIFMAFFMVLAMRQIYREECKADEDRLKADEDRRKSDEDKRKADENRLRADEERRKAAERYEAERKAAEIRHENLLKELQKDREEARTQHREFMDYITRHDKRGRL